MDIKQGKPGYPRAISIGDFDCLCADGGSVGGIHKSQTYFILSHPLQTGDSGEKKYQFQILELLLYL